MSVQHNKDLIHEVISNNQELDRLEEFFTEDFLNHDGPLDAPTGPAAFRACLPMMRQAFPDRRRGKVTALTARHARAIYPDAYKNDRALSCHPNSPTDSNHELYASAGARTGGISRPARIARAREFQ